MTHGNLSTFPSTTFVNAQDHLSIGGCDLVELAEEFGTPLYLFDEETLRDMCAQFRDEFASPLPRLPGPVRKQGIHQPFPGPNFRRGGSRA